MNKQTDGRTGLPSRQALLSTAAVTSSESSVGISAAPLNLSRGNERLAPDNCQHREMDGVTGVESTGNKTKEGTAVSRAGGGHGTEEETSSAPTLQ